MPIRSYLTKQEEVQLQATANRLGRPILGYPFDETRTGWVEEDEGGLVHGAGVKTFRPQMNYEI